MIIQCSSCGAKYKYDEDRFERKPSKKIKCGKCAVVFEIHNPAFTTTPPPAEQPFKSDDPTLMKRRPRTIEEAIDFALPDEENPAQKATSTLQLPIGKRLSLALIDGPDSDKGIVHRIDKPRVTIGRMADISLNDTEASRQHAAIEVHGNHYLLYDLGSTNGTLMNGEKISEPIELQTHSEFLVGNTTLMFIVTEDT